jgi:excisionase family DNA binding protein
MSSTTTASPERLLLKPEEAAEVLQLSRAKVYGLVASGILPSIRFGNLIRIPVDELRAWIARTAATKTHIE